MDLQYESKSDPPPRPPPSPKLIVMGWAALSCLLWMIAPLFASVHPAAGLCVAAAAVVMTVMTCIRARDVLRP